MRLRDEVEVITANVHTDIYGNEVYDWYTPIHVATLPAEVVFTTVAAIHTDGRNALVEELRAILEPFDYDPVAHRLRWKGKQYANEGPPMIRRRNGTDHHLTIPLKQVNG